MEPSLLMFIESPLTLTDTFNSHHDSKHNASTAATLWHRALNLPNSSKGKKRELSRVHAALEYSGYPSKFIQNIQTNKTRSSISVSPGLELVGMFLKMVEPTKSRKSFAFLFPISKA